MKNILRKLCGAKPKTSNRLLAKEKKMLNPVICLSCRNVYHESVCPYCGNTTNIYAHININEKRKETNAGKKIQTVKQS